MQPADREYVIVMPGTVAAEKHPRGLVLATFGGFSALPRASTFSRTITIGSSVASVLLLAGRHPLPRCKMRVDPTGLTWLAGPQRLFRSRIGSIDVHLPWSEVAGRRLADLRDVTGSLASGAGPERYVPRVQLR